MDEIPITGLQELETHLQDLIQDAKIPLKAKLFDEVELQLTETNIPPLIPKLLPSLTQILLTYQDDPTILASLTIKLLRPVPFTHALTLASEDALIQALQSPTPAAIILAIAVIHKAARSPGDTAILSIMKNLVKAFIQAWLSTSEVEVGERATTALSNLLLVDCDRRSASEVEMTMKGLQISSKMPTGQGLLWRRIFQDRDIYESIFSMCSSKVTGTIQLEERQKSLAQARLLRILPRLASLDFQSITRTQFPDVEQAFNVEQPGLLYFASIDMVDKEGDLLMHITLVDFFVEFLQTMSLTDLTQPTVDYLGALVKKAAREDASLYQTLESISKNEETNPELVDLLVKLNDYAVL